MIKASYEILQPVNGQSFLFRKFDSTAFDAPYHFHAEYELTYIPEGRGKRYIGKQVRVLSWCNLTALFWVMIFLIKMNCSILNACFRKAPVA